MTTVRLYPDPHHVIPADEDGNAVPQAMMDVSAERALYLLAFGREGGDPDGEPLSPAFWREPQAPAWEDQLPPAYLAIEDDHPRRATKAELRERADELGLDLPAKATVADLEAAIAGAEAGATEGAAAPASTEEA